MKYWMSPRVVGRDNRWELGKCIGVSYKGHRILVISYRIPCISNMIAYRFGDEGTLDPIDQNHNKRDVDQLVSSFYFYPKPEYP